MASNRLRLLTGDMDGIRLFGLGRIPRCDACPRYAALVDAYFAKGEGAALPSALPGVPANCDTPYCAPLAVRYVDPDAGPHWLCRSA